MRRLEKNELDFSADAWSDLHNFHREVFGFFTLVCKSFHGEGAVDKKTVYSEAARLNDLADEIRSAHLVRMRGGQCGALPALTFSDMAVAMRRIKNHTVNLHQALSEEPSEKEDSVELKSVI